MTKFQLSRMMANKEAHLSLFRFQSSPYTFSY
nr:MAG TPA: hypothetical protein [Caudoviricetes sp.]